MHRAGGGYTRLKFRRNFGGYTVFEVMLVLAISSVILVSTVAAFSGKQNSTEFTQSVQDLASKIQSYASDITSGSMPDFGGARCRNVSGHPHFDNGPGSTDECIFMGRALLVSPNTNSISAYAVVGVRDYGSNAAEFFDQASPDTARQGSTDLSPDNYDLGNLQILSSSVNNTSGYGLVGLYSDLAGTSAPDTANSTGLLTKGYLFSGTSSDVPSCIEVPATTCTSVVSPISNWTLCVQYAGGRRAQIVSTPTGSSLSTRVNVINC